MKYRVIILSHLKSCERHIEARDISSITGYVVRLALTPIQPLVSDSSQQLHEPSLDIYQLFGGGSHFDEFIVI